MNRDKILLVEYAEYVYLERTIRYLVGWFHSEDDENLYVSTTNPPEQDIIQITKSFIIKTTPVISLDALRTKNANT